MKGGNLKKKSDDLDVCWHSTLTRPFGYAMISRALILALEKGGARVGYEYLYGPGTVFPVKEEEDLSDPALNAMKERGCDSSSPHIIFGQGDAFGYVKGRKKERPYRVGYTMLEVSGIPAEWAKRSNEIEEVWTPSPFNAWTFRRSGVEKPICVMPLGVDTTVFNPEAEGYPLDDVFSFLSVFEWGERKAAEVLLTVFNKTFRREEPVVLICKYENNDGSIDVVEQVRSMGLDTDGGRIVFLANRHLAYSDLPKLYRSVDCFVLPTRGEGWGMPLLEAMACGLPVISTYWSAQQTFLTDANSYPLQVSGLTDAKAKCPYYEGFKWAEPDIRHLGQLLRRVFENQEEARAKGERAALDAHEKWSLDHCQERMRARLDEIAEEREGGLIPSFILRLPADFKPRIGFDISRGVGGDVTGVGRSCVELAKSLAALEEQENPFEYMLLPGLADFVHPAYHERYAFDDVADERFTLYRGPLPAFSDSDHFVPGLDLVHSTAYASPDTGDVPLVVTVHDMTFATHPEFHRADNVLFCETNVSRAAETGAAFIAVSQSTKSDLVKSYDVDPDRVHVVYNAVDPKLFRPLADAEVAPVLHAHGIEPGYFLSIGSLEPRKNLKTVLEAMSLYQGPEKLVVVGLSGWKNRELKEAVEAAGGRVVTLGYVPEGDLPALYNGATSTLFPSLYEGFGLPVVESMACATPAVASNNSSFPEVSGGACILLDDPTDAASLADAMTRLSGDTALARRLSEEGLRQAARFSPQAAARSAVAVYRQLLEGAK